MMIILTVHVVMRGDHLMMKAVDTFRVEKQLIDIISYLVILYLG